MDKLKTGFVYYLKNFTAPKVFNGLYFECLLTDQKIPANEKVHEELCHIKDWQHKIYKPKRFKIISSPKGDAFKKQVLLP